MTIHSGNLSNSTTLGIYDTWTEHELTYSFYTSLPTYYNGRTVTFGQGSTSFLPQYSSIFDSSGFNTQQRATVANVFAKVSNFINLSFSEVAEGTDSTFGFGRFLSSYTPDAALAWTSAGARESENNQPGDIWLTAMAGIPATGGLPPDTGYRVIAHEIGHALGLKHTHNPEETPALTGPENSHHFSIMANISTGIPANRTIYEFQLYDVASLQFLYGPNNYYRSNDNDQLGWFDFAQANPVSGAVQNRYFTIWDAGGVGDGIIAKADAPNSHLPDAAYIDLRPGHFSSIGPDTDVSVQNGAVVDSGVRNVSIAFGAYIENAEGTEKNDAIIGNNFSNKLEGGAGDDIIFGSGASIKLANDKAAALGISGPTGLTDEGEGDYDRIVKGGVVDVPAPLESDEVDELRGGEGNDFLVSRAGTAKLYGDAGHDKLMAGDGDDTLEGGEGNDKLYGGHGSDILSGGSGVDEAIFDYRFTIFINAATGLTTTGRFSAVDTLNSIERITGSNDSDRILIQSLAPSVMNALEWIDLGANASDGDSLDAGNLREAVTINLGTGRFDSAGSGFSFRNIEHASGSHANDILIGSAGNDRLYGWFGQDEIHGGAGNDSVNGANDNAVDKLWGGSGADSFQVYGGDIIYDIDAEDSVGYYTALLTGGPVHSSSSERYAQSHSGDLIFFEWKRGSTTLSVYNGGNPRITILDFQNGDGGIFLGSGGFGTRGDDAMTGGDGDDEMSSMDGDDSLAGGAGNDMLDGGNGNDTFLVGVGSGMDQIFGGPGADTLAATADSTVIGLRGILSVETITAAGHSGVSIRTSELNDSYDFRGVTFVGITQIDSAGGNDSITGNEQDNVLLGGSGDDILAGVGGNDSLNGGDGNDVFMVGPEGGFHSIDGGAGADSIKASASNVAIGLGTVINVETISANGFSNVSIRGSDADETWDFYSNNVIGITEIDLGGGGDDLIGHSAMTLLRGGDGNDEIYSQAGNDTLHGDAGDDFLSGWYGSDSYYGGLGNDELKDQFGDDFYHYGLGDGSDVIDEYDGFDVLVLGAGITASNVRVSVIDGDVIYSFADGGQVLVLLGTDPEYAVEEVRFADGTVWTYADSLARAATLGDDVLTGGAGADLIGGLDGSDVIHGAGGNDVLEGGSGDDFLDGGAGADTLRGGAGNDLYVVDDSGDLVEEDAGAGIDEIRTALAVFSLAARPNVENLTGTSAVRQTLTGNAADNVITAGVGDDLLHLWSGGNDTVLAGAGNDNIFFGSTLNGADILNGGAGGDTLILQGDYGSGLVLGPNVTQIESISILAGSNMNFGEPGTNRYDYALTIHDSNFAAGVEARVNGAALLAGEDFTFDGSAETDAKFVIYGGRGKDSLTGGLGNDIFFYAEERFASGDTVNGGPGYDGMFLRGNYTIDFNAPGYTGLFTNIENLTLTSITDERYARGGGTEFDYNLTLSNAIVKPGETLTVSGTLLTASETMIVDATQETDGLLRFFSGKANDVLKGGGQADLIHGNLGADTMTGGGGADTFRYDSTAESNSVTMDAILDFTPGTDKFDLTRVDANALVEGNQAFTWIGLAAFSGSAGQLRAYQSGTTWFLEGDANGDGSADLVVALTLQGPNPLGAGDFLL